MKILKNDYPKKTGPIMPGEYAPHHGTLMIWPYRSGSWRYGARKARKAFAQIICHLARFEEAYVLVREEDMAGALNILQEESQNLIDLFQQNGKEYRLLLDHIHLHECDTDDAWARDTGATFVLEDGMRKGINWQFNAWGGTYDGLYASWEKDQKVARTICQILGDDLLDASPFVLEGGSIHVDGEGTLITTEECLLSPGRNPSLTREEIESKLFSYLGIEKVIWLPEGIYNDETNGHIDNICAFVAPAEVILAWTDDSQDPQYARSSSAYEVLSHSRDAQGRPFTIHRLPIPKKPICITEENLQGYDFEEGEDQREVGERLAASYVNYYVANGCVLVPQFGDVHDSLALELIGKCFPNREIIAIEAGEILAGGGNIHCITQQIPAVPGKK